MCIGQYSQFCGSFEECKAKAYLGYLLFLRITYGIGPTLPAVAIYAVQLEMSHRHRGTPFGAYSYSHLSHWTTLPEHQLLDSPVSLANCEVSLVTVHALAILKYLSRNGVFYGICSFSASRF